MNGEYITDEAQAFIRKLLSTKDYGHIAKHNGFGLSTANNIVNGVTPIYDSTRPLYKALVAAAKKKLNQLQKVAQKL